MPQFPATLHFFGFPGTQAVVTFVHHPRGERAQRAVKALAACWAIAALTVLIPIAHFVLVPALFVTGIVLFARRLGERSAIQAVTGICPCCQSQDTLITSGPIKANIQVQCATCRNELDLAVDPSWSRDRD